LLSNLLVLLLRILNSGESDSRLLAHLVEVTTGSLNSVRLYKAHAVYRLAVKYLFLVQEGVTGHTTPLVDVLFNANQE
jgi:hypothetical protein